MADIPGYIWDPRAGDQGSWVVNPELIGAVTPAPDGTVEKPVFGLPLYGGTSLRPPPPDMGQAAYNEGITNAFTPKANLPWWSQQADGANWLNKGFDVSKYFPGMNAGAAAGAGQPRGTNLDLGGVFGYKGLYPGPQGNNPQNPGIGITPPPTNTINPPTPAPLRPFLPPGQNGGSNPVVPPPPGSTGIGNPPPWTGGNVNPSGPGDYGSIGNMGETGVRPTMPGGNTLLGSGVLGNWGQEGSQLLGGGTLGGNRGGGSNVMSEPSPVELKPATTGPTTVVPGMGTTTRGAPAFGSLAPAGQNFPGWEQNWQGNAAQAQQQNTTGQLQYLQSLFKNNPTEAFAYAQSGKNSPWFQQNTGAVRDAMFGGNQGAMNSWLNASQYGNELQAVQNDAGRYAGIVNGWKG